MDFDVCVPDIPMPEEAEDLTIQDKCEGANKYAFIGAGQGGSRIAQAFWDLGYRRVVAINTAAQDLIHIDIPDSRKLVLGGGGAGKQPDVAAAIFKERKEDVLDLMRKKFGPGFDRVFICAGAGGGTGCGCTTSLIETCEELMASIGAEQKVGMILALPKRSEGKTVNANAYKLLQAVMPYVKQERITPLILLDNERIESMYPGLAVDPFWKTANGTVAALFHLFNAIAIKDSRYTSFDQADYKTLLDSGLIVFGATPIKKGKWKDESAISFAVRDNLKRNMLAGGIELDTGTIAGAVIIGSEEILNEVPQASLEHAFEQLSRILKEGNTVHRGIYRGDKPNLVVYTMLGGLAAPEKRMEELKALGAK